MTGPVLRQAEGGVCAPAGFLASGVHAEIKRGSAKKDCALVFSEEPATVAGTFTKNVLKAPPVRWSADICASSGRARAVFVNSGNANAATGEKGMADAQETARLVAEELGIGPREVCVSSTGVIGVPLPMDRIALGAKYCVKELSNEGSSDAARAIMTTDTEPKEAGVAVDLEEGGIHIGAIAKGSGMISPDMATMICVLTTDAAIEPEALSGLLRQAVGESFNRICVDNDMSTSDTVLCLANGKSPVPALAPGTPAYDAFGEALKGLCQKMAQWLVRDGEGATKFVEIEIEGADNDGDARAVARAIAHSQLCKTAFYGEDPNWGRLACAAGYAGVAFDPGALCIWLDDVQVAAKGLAADYSEPEAAAVMKQHEFRVRVRLGQGPGRAIYWTSDLSHQYVTVNADYRT